MADALLYYFRSKDPQKSLFLLQTKAQRPPTLSKALFCSGMILASDRLFFPWPIGNCKNPMGEDMTSIDP
jgi:hypothetical protein